VVSRCERLTQEVGSGLFNIGLLTALGPSDRLDVHAMVSRRLLRLTEKVSRVFELCSRNLALADGLNVRSVVQRGRVRFLQELAVKLSNLSLVAGIGGSMESGREERVVRLSLGRGGGKERDDGEKSKESHDARRWGSGEG
jgi:hypothetical protein